MGWICVSCGSIFNEFWIPKCSICGAEYSWLLNYFKYRNIAKINDTLSKHKGDERIIEFAKLLIEGYVSILPFTEKRENYQNLINKLKELGEIKLAVLLKLILI